MRRGVGPPGARDRILRFVASSRRIVLGRRCTLLVGKCGISIHYSVSQRRVNSNWHCSYITSREGGQSLSIFDLAVGARRVLRFVISHRRLETSESA